MTYANDTHATFARILQNLGAHFSAEFSAQNERFYTQNFREQDGLNDDFCTLLKALFGINASKANADDLREIGENPAAFFAQSALFSATHFDFENALLYYTNTDLSDIAPASTGHKNIGFTLMPCASHKRADLANATRAINKAIANYNIIFFVGEDSSLRGGKAIHAKNSVNLNQNPQNSLNFHANSAKNPQIQSKNSRPSPHLSIAFATRRFSRQTTLKKDIVEKIIIIKDINLRAPSLAQLLNLEKLHREFASTLAHAKAQRIALDEFYARVIEIFSISALNSEFYAEIVRIFNALWHECKFPQNTSEGDKRAFCLRLICRLLFCKFLEKKGLINERLWDTNLAQDYYHELLEPLFFATLNTPQNERDYFSYGILDENLADEKSPALAEGDLGGGLKTHEIPVNLNANSAQNSPNLQTLLNSIPYLNGGLFAAQKNDFFNPQNPVQNRGILAVPNALIEAFFTLLSRYHFSIDEGSVNVQIVGLNPELLGLVFENLLAKLSSEQDEAALAKSLQSDIEDFEKSQKSEKNPKNSQRKATGSYYTPREIVSFMVRESLFAYLCRATKIHAEKLREFIFTDEAAHFENAETSAILCALKSLKILDPACGSGAFPMGILNEILALQERLGDTRTPHARKLEALQSCIYGIDIQPMATEIARLRCFLSLIIDENPHDIKPLPNLEFKFICANSLLPLPVSTRLHYDGYERDLQRLNELRNEYFSTQQGKKALQSAYTQLREDITRADLQVNMSDESLKNPLLAYDPFDSQSVAGFFDSEFMFGVRGFDIVIGNPPYISSENMPQIIKDSRHLFKTAHKKTDIYVYFYEIGLNLLKQNGIISYITSNKFLSQDYGLKLRDLFLQNTILSIVNFNVNVFQSASVDTCICLILKDRAQNNKILVKNINSKGEWAGFENVKFDLIEQDIFYELENHNFRLTLNDKKLSLLRKIQANSLKLSDICFVSYGCRPCGNDKNPNLTKKDLVHSTPQGNAKPYVEAKDNYLTRYAIHSHDFLDYQADKIYNAMFVELFAAKKLMAGRTLTNVAQINFVYDDKGRFCNDSMCCSVLWKDMKGVSHASPKKQITQEKIENSMKYDLKFLQGVLNSSVVRFYEKELLHDGLHFYPEHQKQLPIPKINSQNSKIAAEIVNLVNQILTLKAENLDADISGFERDIDNLTYKLYNLTDYEIKIIERK